MRASIERNKRELETMFNTYLFQLRYLQHLPKARPITQRLLGQKIRRVYEVWKRLYLSDSYGRCKRCGQAIELNRLLKRNAKTCMKCHHEAMYPLHTHHESEIRVAA
jgi:hypothetical protein